MRVSAQRTGRLSRMASQPTMNSSGDSTPLAPKPPPTSPATTRTADGPRPKVVSRAVLLTETPWVETVKVSRSPSHSAAQARPSMGAGATRWLTMRCDTTTSAPAKRSSTGGRSSRATTLVPCSGNSRVVSLADSSTSTTTGRGS